MMLEDTNYAKKRQREEEEHMHKSIVYYQTFLSAWVSSRMEKDKQVLTLSALAIGLLMTFRGNLDNKYALLIWVLANVSFVSAIIYILLIFAENSDYIEKIISDDIDSEEIKLEKSLHRKTFRSFMFFIIGAVLTIFLAMFELGLAIIKGM